MEKDEVLKAYMLYENAFISGVLKPWNQIYMRLSFGVSRLPENFSNSDVGDECVGEKKVFPSASA